MSSPLASVRRAPWFAYVELVRLPNLFTAVADVVMGFLFTHPQLTRSDRWTLLVLLASSSSLYSAGMVLNDVFDVRIDARLRPFRPLPSRRISLPAARRLGWALLVLGLAFAWMVTALAGGDLRPAAVGTLLAGSIVLYDAYAKRTPVGPVAMGACRLLNVLLGMSLVMGPWQKVHWLIAGALGTYIAGVTWFARSEAVQSRRGHLGLALVVLLSGVALLNWVPEWTDQAVALLRLQPLRWKLLLGALGLLIFFRCSRAVLEPTSRRVQMAVRHCLLSLIMLNAAIAFVVWDIPGAVAVMLFLIPAVLLGQWTYLT